MRLVDLLWNIIDGEDAPHEVLTLDDRFAIPVATEEKEQIMKSADQVALAAIFNDVYAKIAAVGDALAAHIANDALTVPAVQTLIDASLSEAAEADPTFDISKVTAFVPVATDPVQAPPAA